MKLLLSEKDKRIILEFALERGWDKKIGKKDENRVESLLAHHLKTLYILDSLLSVTKNDLNFSDDDLKIALISATVHDAGKEIDEWQNKIATGSKKFVSHVDRKLSEEILNILFDRLEWEVTKESFTDAINAIMQHMEGTRKSPESTLKSILSSTESGNRSRWVSISHLVSFADRLASITDPSDCLNILRGVGLTRLADIIDLDYHKVNQIRGISTTLLHSSVEKAMTKFGWSPILFFSNGTVYLRPKKERGEDEFSWEKFETFLQQELEQFLEQYRDNESETVVGNPTASLINLPRLFNWKHIQGYFDVAMDRTRTKKSPAGIKPKNVLKYLVCRRIREKDGFDRAIEFLNNRERYEKKYGKIEEIAISEDDPIFQQTRAEFAEINPEATLFKFFKGVFDDATIATSEMVSKAEEEFDEKFGQGQFKKLQSMSTLQTARDRITAIDNFWSLSALLFDSQKQGPIKNLPARTRQKLLKNALLEIAIEAYENRSSELPSGYAEILKNIAKIDLVNPSFYSPLELKEQCQNYLEHWFESKHSQKSLGDKLYICPRCNQKYDKGNLVAAEISGFKKKFSNRVIGGSRISKGVSICTNCELELLLRYLTLRSQASDFVVFYPEISIQRDLGEQIMNQINNFQDGLREFGPFKTTSQFDAFSFRSIYSAAVRIINQPNILESLARHHHVEDLIELFAFKRSEDSVKKLLQQAFERTLEKLEIDASSLPEVESIDDAVNAITAKDPSILREPLKEILSKSIPSESDNLRFFHRTPNFFIWSTRQPLVSLDESEVNIAIKKVFIATLLSIFTGYSVAILDPDEVIPPKADGRVYIPPNNHIRRLFNNQGWIRDQELLQICKKISVAIVVAKRGEYPPRSAVYSVLSESVKGKILRRIEQKRKYVDVSDIKNIETLFGSDLTK